MPRTFELSFEIFPPRTAEDAKALQEMTHSLSEFNPTFFSVTFGAGGSTRDRTLETVFQLQTDLGEKGISAVPHLSCIGSEKETLKIILSSYKEKGIDRVVVLRGDLPSGMGGSTGDFQFAYQLVAQIRQWFGDYFHIDVAAYPEFHPQSDTPHMDLTHFKQKIEAGANGAITQYFFCKEAYARLLDSCAFYKIDCPIVPGVMPIQNFQKLKQFSQFCGAEIPRWLYKRLEGFGADQAGIRQYGIDVIGQLCEDLLALGAPGLHFYTLNRIEPTATICRDILMLS